MKNKIKTVIAGLPGIRGFMKKWIRARKEIKKLQAECVTLHQENRALEAKCAQFDKLNADVSRNCVVNDLLRLEERRKCKTNETISIKKIGETVDAFDQLCPLVSIVVLNRNGENNLRVLLESFVKKDFYKNYEIICIDNNSSDGSIDLLGQYADLLPLSIVRNSENKSFSAGNNQALAFAKGDYLLFLNNDTEITNGWLDELVETALTVKDPGAIGGKLIYPEVPAGSLNEGKSYRIQHAGIAFRPTFRDCQFFIQPYNMGNGALDVARIEVEPEERACVTAAVMLVSREAFEEVGGFDEKYEYGYEDVDLCLKLAAHGYKNYYCPACVVFHYEFGTQQKDQASSIRKRRRRNAEIFMGKWQRNLERVVLDDKLRGAQLYSESKLCVAFVVTEASASATAGDYFTASELAGALERIGCRVKFLCRSSKDWYDVGLEADVLISLLDAYDIKKIKNSKSDLVKIAWPRNWFERWCRNGHLDLYDIVLASSQSACDYIFENSSREPILFPIATNQNRFDKMRFSQNGNQDVFEADYVFTGSYWNAKRDIVDCLAPEELPYTFKIFGANWDKVPNLKDYACGFVNYENMPRIYSSTRIVIDDANQATKKYGSVNSRVFDALATGALVITNNLIGADEVFDGLLPTFSTKQELNSEISYYLEHDDERMALVEKLRSIVLSRHTYDLRARRFMDIVSQYNDTPLNPLRIDIVGAMPGGGKEKHWGDYHFALSLGKELEKRGYNVNIVFREHWYDRTDASVIIVLRGTKPYYPSYRDGRIYIMWNISHPDDIGIEEYNMYDHVFFASEALFERYRGTLSASSSVLLQCTDPDLMKRCGYLPEESRNCELLFIGNSRGVFRPILKDLLPTDHELVVYGEHWDGFPVKEYVAKDYLENDCIADEYHSAKIVLNDHWQDMKREGIISNRVFDVLAAGGFLISDDVPGIGELFGDSVVTYSDREDLAEKLQYYLDHPDERLRKIRMGQSIVLSEHTFANRAKDIERVLKLLRRDE